jgi:hypothetical protein
MAGQGHCCGVDGLYGCQGHEAALEAAAAWMSAAPTPSWIELETALYQE